MYNSLGGAEFGTDLSKISIKGLGYDEHAYIDGNDSPEWYVFSGKTHIDVLNELFSEVIPFI